MGKTNDKLWNLGNVESLKWNWLWSQGAWDGYQCFGCALLTKRDLKMPNAHINRII